MIAPAELADEFKALVHKRTGISGNDLVCPREKSAMTPCIARDGGLAVSGDQCATAVCVGCGEFIEALLVKERQKQASSK